MELFDWLFYTQTTPCWPILSKYHLFLTIFYTSDLIWPILVTSSLYKEYVNVLFREHTSSFFMNSPLVRHVHGLVCTLVIFMVYFVYFILLDEIILRDILWLRARTSGDLFCTYTFFGDLFCTQGTFLMALPLHLTLLVWYFMFTFASTSGDLFCTHTYSCCLTLYKGPFRRLNHFIPPHFDQSPISTTSSWLGLYTSNFYGLFCSFSSPWWANFYLRDFLTMCTYLCWPILYIRNFLTAYSVHKTPHMDLFILCTTFSWLRPEKFATVLFCIFTSPWWAYFYILWLPARLSGDVFCTHPTSWWPILYEG